MARLGRGRPQRGFIAGPAVAASGPTNVNASDTGAGVDTASNTSATAAAADTGSGVDLAASPVVAVFAADTGTGVDTASNTSATLSAADTRPAATDTAASPVVALTAADTGAGVDSAAYPTTALTAADTGAGVDNATVQQGATNVSASDTGTGVDSAAYPAVALTAANTGTGVDAAAAPSVAVSAADTRPAGTDTASLAAALAGSDTGAGVDAVLRVGLTATDTGTGTDTAAPPVVAVTAADTRPAGVDTAASIGIVAADARPAATDTASLAAGLTATDSGTGADTAGTNRLAADTGTGVDAASVAIIYNRSDNMEQANNTALTTGNSLFDLLVGTGSGTFKTTPTAAEGSSSLEWASTGTGYRGKDTGTLPGATNGGTALTSLFGRVYLRNTGAPSAANRIWVFESSVGSGGTDIAGLRLQTNNTMRLGDAGVYPATGSTRALSSTEWTRLEWHVDQDNNTQELRMWWGADLHNASTGATNYESLTAALNDNTAIEVWGIGNFAGVTHTLYVDALAISSEGWIGPATGVTDISASDAGTGTDTAGAPAVALSAADTGSGANATTLATALTAADTGSGADTVVNSARTATDTGSGVDTAAYPAVAVTAADTRPAATDTVVNSARVATDTGTGVDAAGYPAVAVSAADTGVGADSASVNAGGIVSTNDTGTGVDSASLAAALAGADTGAGANNATVAAGLFPGETGTGANNATVAVAVQGSDGASLVDFAFVTVLGSTTPSGDDQGTFVDLASVFTYPLVWLFTPPVDGSSLHRQGHYPTNQVMKRTSGAPRHITLMVYGATVVPARKPTTAMLEAADFVYEGPANYPISDEERVILEAAGYGEPWLRQDSLPV